MMENPTIDIDDAEVFELDGTGVTYAVDTSGMVYLNGDLHPRGGPAAILEALAEDIAWIPMDAINAYFPLPWMVQKCDNGVSPERMEVMLNLVQAIRGKG
jgi:hypothetical protein